MGKFGDSQYFLDPDLMKDLFGKCGANCGHYPAYKENAKTVEARQRCRDGWSFDSKAGGLAALEAFKS